jgi:hypothetical protein
MSVLACIARLARAGKITEQQAKDARAVYEGIANEDLFRNMDAASAEAYAALKMAEALQKSADAKVMELSRRAQLYDRNSARINEHPNGPVAGFMALYGRDLRNAPGDRINVTGMAEDYKGRILQKMHGFEDAYGPKAAGLKQNTTGIREMIRERFGVKTGDAVAAAQARGWKEATDFAVDRARALGKAFETAEDWRVPQFWTSDRVNKLGRNAFVDDIRKEVEAGALRVHHPETGKAVTGAEREQVISDAALHIMQDLARKAGPASVFKDEMRVFRFNEGAAGADAYLRLMDKYGPGQGGYFAMLQGHVQRMSHELGLLHVIGPSWRAASEQLLKDAVEADAARARPKMAVGAGQKAGDFLLRAVGLESPAAAKRLHLYMTGQLSGVESEAVAGIMQGARSWLTASNLGSAIVTAIPTDSVNWLMAANYRGLDLGRITKGVTDTFLHDTPDRAAVATRMGIVAHATSSHVVGTRQFGDEVLGRSLPSRLADFTIRAQGLHAWDTGVKRAFTMEFLASIGERMGQRFDDLEPAFKSFFRDYGFTAEDWAALQRGKLMEGTGEARFLSPDSLEEGIRAKLMSAIYDERTFAYLGESEARVKALTTGGAKAGTLAGEMARNFFLFKSFALTMASTWGVRAAQDAAGGRMSTAIQLGLFATFAGAIALQAKDILSGKDPRAMDSGWFWAEAAFQGGAVGVYGDFLKEATSPRAGSLTEAMLGPVASIPGAVSRLTSGARRMAEEGQNFNAGGAIADDLRKFTPGGNLWYARLLFNRYLVDNVRAQLDPDYLRAFARERERAQKLHGQGFWFAPGENAPERAPDFGSVMGRP